MLCPKHKYGTSHFLRLQLLLNSRTNSNFSKACSGIQKSLKKRKSFLKHIANLSLTRHGSTADTASFSFILNSVFKTLKVSIRRQGAGARNVYCSGTIVNANHIVTATSCAHESGADLRLINPFWFRIIAGDLNILVPSFRRFETRASHIYTHPQYAFQPRQNDIAVMRVRNLRLVQGAMER